MELAHLSIETLKGVGPKVAEKFSRLGIDTLEDLLFHLPYKYQDRSKISPIGSLVHGQTAQVFGEIEAADIVFGKRRSLVCKISDSTGIMDIRLFYFSMAQKKQFVRGEFIQCYGQVSHSGRSISMIHPEMKFLKSNSTPQLNNRLTAIYPTTEGLQQRTFQSAVKQALEKLTQANIRELLPVNLLAKLDFPPLHDALKLLHNPPVGISIDDIQNGEHPLVKRLAFEELMAHHIALKRLKQKHQSHQSFPVSKAEYQKQEFLNSLPFTLTDAQQRVINEVENDLEKSIPMMRLVQGDVGCGKTLIAAVAALNVASSQSQTVLMAPTELLAEQHFLSFSHWFAPLGIKVKLLISSLPTAEKRQTLEDISNGDCLIVIGTHAVFQKQVNFSRLAFVIIDEQHRFGVEQRKTLLEKGLQEKSGEILKPHQLVMTATPIPRTLAQTTYADLDLSIVDQLPPGRKPIETSVISDANRLKVIQRIKQSCQTDGRQVYWVCTLIDESEELACQAAEATYNDLCSQLAPLKVGLVHGRSKPAEKHQTMERFKHGEIDLLVATTVIEVGVDVPNASLMIIENPERLGLSQLHQLRGRVGRGELQSYCILMYHPPLSNNAKQRLNVMRETCDGFVVAEKDLEIRGAGEVLGTRQTGEVLFRFADLMRDRQLLPQVQQNADIIIEQHPAIIQGLLNRWVKQGEQLSQV